MDAVHGAIGAENLDQIPHIEECGGLNRGRLCAVCLSHNCAVHMRGYAVSASRPARRRNSTTHPRSMTVWTMESAAVNGSFSKFDR